MAIVQRVHQEKQYAVGGGLRLRPHSARSDLISCVFRVSCYWGTDVTGAPYREVNSKVATAPNTQSRRYR